MDGAQVATIVTAPAASAGVQAYWIARALDRVGARIDRLDVRLDGIEGLLREQGERIAHLEAARG